MFYACIINFPLSSYQLVCGVIFLTKTSIFLNFLEEVVGDDLKNTCSVSILKPRASTCIVHESTKVYILITWLISDVFSQETLTQTGLTEGYPKPCKIYEMQLLAKIINSFQPLTIFATVTILDVWQGSEYACEQQVGTSFLKIYWIWQVSHYNCLVLNLKAFQLL